MRTFLILVKCITKFIYYYFLFFLLLVLASSIGASSGARVSDAVLACSASKDFCKDEIGQRRFQRYSRVLGPQPRIIEQSSPLNGVGKFVKKENFHPQWESNPCTLTNFIIKTTFKLINLLYCINL